MNHVGLILDEKKWSSPVKETPALSFKIARANLQIIHPSAVIPFVVQPLVALLVCYEGKLHFLLFVVDIWARFLSFMAPPGDPASTCAVHRILIMGDGVNYHHSVDSLTTLK